MKRSKYNEVQSWCHHAKELKNTQISKALKFIEYNCLRYVGKDSEFNSKYTYVVLPLNEEESIIVDVGDGKKLILEKTPCKFYNNTTYKIFKGEHGVFECNCQGWQTAFKKRGLFNDGCMCSHVLALMLKFKADALNQKIKMNHSLNNWVKA